MPIITPTIHFNGKCGEAIELYQKAFDAQVKYLFRYTDRNEADWSDPIPAGQEHFIYHAEITIGDRRIMMGDDPALDSVRDNAAFLTVTFDCADDVKAAYEAIVNGGGTILYPMQSTTYSSCMGSVIDKFGVRWGLMTEQTER